ncbi:MAG: metallophosphoesterase [Nitrososphaerota archaeon]
MENEPAAILSIKNKRMLLVADLHIGFEYELYELGIRIPPQSKIISQNFLKLIEKTSPNEIFILGDLKHNIPKASKFEWKILPELIELMNEKVDKINLIIGNHDGTIKKLIPSKLFFHSSHGILIEDNEKIGLIHGHAWPSKKILLEADTIILAHIHPTIQLKTSFGFSFKQKVWINFFLKREEILKKLMIKKKIKKPLIKIVILPAFNDFLSGTPINITKENKYVSPLLRINDKAIEESEIFLLDGTFLGKLKSFKRMII